MVQETKIYIATHKKFSPPHDHGYIPIFAGKSINPDADCKFMGDDTGDNISNLNKRFCELTVLYWMWKNDNNSDIIGLNHYRRFFEKKHKSIDLYREENELKSEIILTRGREIASISDFDHIRNEVDLVISKYYVNNVMENYRSYHKIEDFFFIENKIKSIFPDYMDAYNFYMRECNFIYKCNMFVGKSHVVKSYCEWLFNILIPLNEYKCFSNYDDYQSRVFGFMSERMFGVWIIYNRDKLCLEERGLVEF